MDEKFNEEIFARQKVQAEQLMKVVLAIFAVVILLSLYFLMQD